MKYLLGVTSVPFDQYPGIFAVTHHRRADSSRFISSYADGKTNKPELFKFLARAGQIESRRQWDLHHIVEGQHFADVDFTGRLQTMYQKELPVVLIQKDEHVAYNMLLHVSATDEMFRDTLPADLLARSRAAMAAAAQPAQRPALRARVDKLIELYDGAYMSDPVLTQIAGELRRLLYRPREAPKALRSRTEANRLRRRRRFGQDLKGSSCTAPATRS
jgi:hypothetical protein